MIELTGFDVDADQVWSVAYEGEKLKLSESAKAAMQESKDYIQGRLDNGEVMYGVNTGFGAFSDVKISQPDIVQLQKNLIRSHCTGIGEPFSPNETRAIMFLRANALARGHSGIRPNVVEKIVDCSFGAQF